MYKNVVSLKNGRVMMFETEVPYSIEKTKEEWSVIVDTKTNQVLSFKGSEIVTIASAKVTVEKKKTSKKPNIKTAITEE